MTFASPLPWWAVVPLAAGAAFVAWSAYRRFNGSPARRYTLSGIRFATLAVLVVVLMRPVARSVDIDARDAVVPILVDTSRSMGIEDADGRRRVDRARDLVANQLLPALNGRFSTEVLSFGERLQPVSAPDLGATARRSDLAGALSAARERFRGRPVAGVVVISDGGDTGGAVLDAGFALQPFAPVFPFGVGSEDGGTDREVLSVTALESVLDESRVDLAVSAVSRGPGSQPLELRLLENGRTIEVRRVRPAVPGAPIREVFKVVPAGTAATVYRVEAPADAGELVPENNSRSVLVQPPPRRRRVLLVEGAPGFDHSFLKRTLAADRALDLDSVVRKGVNEQGADTFYIQSASARSDALARGFPSDTRALFAYDAIVFGNIGNRQLAPEQMEMTREFVARRGGGVLLLGAQSFVNNGLAGTALEDTLPLALGQRSDLAVPASIARAANRVALTEAGLQHPVMSIAPNAEESRKRWEALPPLAAAANAGTARPGALVLATMSGAAGVSRPLVAVQRYGEGRSMVFTGEASWRWRMLQPSTDRSYETFWRQAVRWLAHGATDRVALVPPQATSPGDDVALRVSVRDETFRPLRDADVTVRIAAPDGRLYDAGAALENSDSTGGATFGARFTPAEPGVYKVTARARRGGGDAVEAAAAFLVGGADVEMTDPRLNKAVLARLAQASGGRVFDSGQTDALLDALRANVPAAAIAVRRDLWHNAWSLAAIVLLLGSEWVLRRRWGLR